mgnify:CR=1 FL=1
MEVRHLLQAGVGNLTAPSQLDLQRICAVNTDAALAAYLGPWLEDAAVAAIDALVLGCTHYPVFKPALARLLRAKLGREVALVDSAQAVTSQLAALLPTGRTGEGEVSLWATDSVERFARVGGLFFPVAKASVRLVDL